GGRPPPGAAGVVTLPGHAAAAGAGVGRGRHGLPGAWRRDRRGVPRALAAAGGVLRLGARQVDAARAAGGVAGGPGGAGGTDAVALAGEGRRGWAAAARRDRAPQRALPLLAAGARGRVDAGPGVRAPKAERADASGAGPADETTAGWEVMYEGQGRCPFW